MSVVLLKFVHIAAIALWAAGLICFPFLTRQRNNIGRETDLHQLHSMARYFYVVILSPAAFIAIASGMVLMFQQQTFTAWFSLKLLLVGLLAGLHLVTGVMVIQVFEKSGHMPAWRYAALTTTTIVIVTGILAVVLVKPQFEWRVVDSDLFAPGALGEVFGAGSAREARSAPLTMRDSLSRVDHESDPMMEYQLAAMPAGEAGENGCEHGQPQPMRQHFLGSGQPQPPVGAGDRQQRHRDDGVRPAPDPTANAFHREQLGRAGQRCEHTEPEGEPRAPHTGAQEERIAEKPIEDVDAQRGND